MTSPVSRVAPPLPGRAIVRQTWSDVSFLHWQVDTELVRPHLPQGVHPDEFEGTSWVGLVGFVLGDHRFLPLPPVPVLGTFAEVNVRLYTIDDDGNRGVVFCSLDAHRLLPVLAARAMFSLPYIWARTGVRRGGDVFDYAVLRHGRTHTRSRFTVRAAGERDDSDLATFLTARWGFHERTYGRTIYARNVHAPWPVERGILERIDDGLLAAAGFADAAGRPPDLVHVARGGVVTDFSAGRPVGSERHSG
ncbi:DUF2071 domain-containing protein [Microbacterium sediminicola]|uniref:DUF2071 domain-containing protein n=1 Tax=Microbacterium sediminicola TaxID=415210 RepID=A0ABP4TIK3_9MICO